MKKTKRKGFITCKQCNGRLKSKNLEKHLLRRCSSVRKKESKTRYTSETYQSEYLKSPHWREIQKRFYSMFPFCLLCQSTKNLNIHHITYRRLGFEKDSDLIVLCEDCHIVKIHQEKTYNRRQLKIIVQAFLREAEWGSNNGARRTEKAISLD